MHEHTCVWVATMYTADEWQSLRILFSQRQHHDQSNDLYILSLGWGDLPEQLFPHNAENLWHLMLAWMNNTHQSVGHSQSAFSLLVNEDFDETQAEEVLRTLPHGMQRGHWTRPDAHTMDLEVSYGGMRWALRSHWMHSRSGGFDMSLTMAPVDDSSSLEDVLHRLHLNSSRGGGLWSS